MRTRYLALLLVFLSGPAIGPAEWLLPHARAAVEEEAFDLDDFGEAGSAAVRVTAQPLDTTVKKNPLAVLPAVLVTLLLLPWGRERRFSHIHPESTQ
ncbi:MAG: hypothetical protein GF331_04965 [Chitinivibrionales bacterium]|nr:hypothetical protein [Chitinivibrionales bacterium]